MNTHGNACPVCQCLPFTKVMLACICIRMNALAQHQISLCLIDDGQQARSQNFFRWWGAPPWFREGHPLKTAFFTLYAMAQKILVGGVGTCLVFYLLATRLMDTMDTIFQGKSRRIKIKRTSAAWYLCILAPLLLSLVWLNLSIVMPFWATIRLYYLP